MKLKYLTVLATAAAISSAASVALAAQKHDPQFQSPFVIDSQRNDPNLTSQVRDLPGSPKAKADLYMARATPVGTDVDLVQNIRSQDGSPKSKTDPVFALAPLK